MRNIKLTIAYDGSNFHGWQTQKNGPTIQETIEQRLSLMTGSKIQVHGAGRTDAGVHALGMCAHFLTHSTITCSALCKGLNSLLPASIRILKAEEMHHDFHARFSAKAKKYEYRFFTGHVQSPLDRLFTVHIPWNLDLQTIRECLSLLEGTRDFSSFENSGTRDKTIPTRKGAIRTLFSAKLINRGTDQYSLLIEGDGFLRNMVRNIAGTVFEVGRGKLAVEEFKTILEACDRTHGGPTAPAHGLVLLEVIY